MGHLFYLSRPTGSVPAAAASSSSLPAMLASLYLGQLQAGHLKVYCVCVRVVRIFQCVSRM